MSNKRSQTKIWITCGSMCTFRMERYSTTVLFNSYYSHLSGNKMRALTVAVTHLKSHSWWRIETENGSWSVSHVWMWELDCEESWTPKNWCFWTVVLEKTLASPLDSKEIKPVDHKGDRSWIFTGKTDAEAEASMLWPPDGKSWLIGKDPGAMKDWGQEEEEVAEDGVVWWCHWCCGHEIEQTLGDGEGQGSLACCSPWGYKELDCTELLKTIIV